MTGHLDLGDDGDEALAKLRDTPADVIVIEILLPQKNGYQLCRALKADPKDTEARKNLDNPPRVYTEIAIEQLDGNRDFFKDAVADGTTGEGAEFAVEDRQLPEEGGLRVGKHLFLVLRQQFARKAEGHIGDAADGEPDAQEPWQESRPVHQQREGKEPQTPEDLGGKDLLAVHAEEQHGQSIPLRFFEFGQEVGAARQRQGSRIAGHSGAEYDAWLIRIQQGDQFGLLVLSERGQLERPAHHDLENPDRRDRGVGDEGTPALVVATAAGIPAPGWDCL